MFFYYGTISGADFTSLDAMSRRNNDLLMIGGALGPIAAVFYSFGSLMKIEMIDKDCQPVLFYLKSILFNLFTGLSGLGNYKI